MGTGMATSVLNHYIVSRPIINELYLSENGQNAYLKTKNTEDDNAGKNRGGTING